MLYFLLHALAIVLPGYVLTSLFSLYQNRLLNAIALSYGFFTLLAAWAKWTHADYFTFIWLYVGLLGVGCAIVVLKASLLPRAKRPAVDRNAKWGIVGIIGVYALYRLWAGAYTELPSDLFQHLVYAQQQLRYFEFGTFGTTSSFTGLLQQGGGIWYSFFALFAGLSKTPFAEAMPIAMWLNGTAFLLAVYCFAYYLGEALFVCSKKRLAFALLSTALLAVIKGISVFAYVRYYSFAPTMLNFIVYFAALVQIDRLLRAGLRLKSAWILLPVYLLTALLVHTQEALFIVVMGTLVLTFYAWQPKAAGQKTNKRVNPVFLLWCFVVLIWMVAEFWVFFNIERPGHFFNKVLQWQQHGLIQSRVLFLNPSFQFMQVVTAFGLIAWLVSFIYRKELRASPYLYMGLWLPIVTVFNPLFVDWFLRLDGPHTLWRLLFLLPISFYAAWLLLSLPAKIMSQTSSRWLAALAALALLFALVPNPALAPWQHARQTLAPVDNQNSYEHWHDLTHYLNTLPERQKILTDPVTGYLVKALTPHATYSHKFQKGRSFDRFQFVFADYKNEPLKQYAGHLLVVNLRDGEHSETGVASKHWSGDVLKVSDFYPEQLRQYIARHKSRFQRLWQSNGVSVYQITEQPLSVEP